MDKHIINLLKTNNRVIIPEFGAFIVKSGTPRTIVFNEFLKYNDEVLLNEICKAENISESEASQKLEEFTRELNSQLDLGQNHKVESLGTLSKDKNGRIHFTMLSEAEIKAESKPVEEVKPIVTEVKEPIEEKPVKEKVTEDKPPIEQNPEKSEPVTLNKSPEATKTEIELDVPATKVEDKKENVVLKDTVKPTEEKKEETKKQEPISIKQDKVEEKKPEKKLSVTEDKKTPITLNEKLQAKKSTKVENKKPPIKKEEPNDKKSEIIEYVNNNKNVVWYALVGVIVILITIWFFANREYLFDSKEVANNDEIVIQPDLSESESVESSGAEDKGAMEDGVSAVETAESATEKQVATTQAKTPVVKEEKKPAVTTVAQTSGKRYYIVAGCFKQENNANEYVTYLNGQGFNSQKFGKYGDLFAVSFNSFTSFSDAQKELSKIKKSTEPAAWILYY